MVEMSMPFQSFFFLSILVFLESYEPNHPHGRKGPSQPEHKEGKVAASRQPCHNHRTTPPRTRATATTHLAPLDLGDGKGQEAPLPPSPGLPCHHRPQRRKTRWALPPSQRMPPAATSRRASKGGGGRPPLLRRPPTSRWPRQGRRRSPRRPTALSTRRRRRPNRRHLQRWPARPEARNHHLDVRRTAARRSSPSTPQHRHAAAPVSQSSAQARQTWPAPDLLC